MAIEIKVTGNDAAETVQQFLGLAGYFGASHTVAVAPVAATGAADDEESDTGAVNINYDTDKDRNGVGFDAQYFGKAQVPFYPNGAWKKRKGVSQADYDRVYAEKLAALKAPAPTEQPEVIAPTPVVAPAPEPVLAPIVETVAAVIEAVAPAPQPIAPAPAAPAPAAPATGKTHAELQGALTKTLQTLATALPTGEAPKVLMSLLSSYGVSGMPQVPADKVDECYDRMQRMAADPANAATIAVGLM